MQIMSMRRTRRGAARLAAGVVLTVTAMATAWPAPAPGVPAGQHEALLRHGRYLVRHVAMCADCHTARGPGGRLDMSRWLQGAAIGSRPLHPHPWATRAPDIAGLPAGWTFAQVVHLLRTGERPDGSHPLPPMPPYRMDARDARAVAAYLASLAH